MHTKKGLEPNTGHGLAQRTASVRQMVGDKRPLPLNFDISATIE